MKNGIDQVFGAPDARRALVVAGACGNVGFGKLGQFARLLSKHGVPVIGLDLAEQVADVPERLRAEFGKKFDTAVVDKILASTTCVQGGIDAIEQPIGMVFEAIPERIELKRAFYAQIREVAPEAIIISATSGFTTRKLFGELPGSERCGVLHPFFPHLTNKLFEFPFDGVTSEQTQAEISALFKQLGLILMPVRDVPSFAADRVFCMMMTEAVRIHAETGMAPGTIDGALHDLLGTRPFLVHNMIFGSNALTISCIDELATESKSNFYDVPELFREYAADLDRKWDTSKRDKPTAEERALVRSRVFGALFAISSLILEKKICTARNLNLMCEQALAFRKGIPAVARVEGLEVSSALVSDYLSSQSITLPEEVAAPAVLTDAAQLDGLYISTGMHDGHLVISLGRSAINSVYVEEFDAALDLLEQGDAQGAVLIADGVINQEFGRGADVTEFLPALGDEATATKLSERWKSVFARIRSIGKPVVAALSRRSLGGSNEIAALCHGRVATPGTTIGQPEPVVGVIPGLGGTTTLLRGAPAASRPRIAELLLTGDPISAEEAVTLGLIQQVVAPAELLDSAISLARLIAAGNGPSFEEGSFELEIPADVPMTNAAGIRLDATYRALLQETLTGCAARTFSEAMQYETAQSGKAFTLSAARIGVNALLRGKKPEFDA